MRVGTPMQRLRDRRRVSVTPERLEALRERGMEQEAEQVVVVAQATDELFTVAGAAVELAQAASTASNDVQTTADEALASGSTSGSSTDPAIDISGEEWVQGPQVNLTGVVSGTLKITGSGPRRDDDVMVDAGTFFGEWRIVEIDGMTEETVFTGDFRAYVPKPGLATPVVNESAAEVSAFSMARTTTGAISYRLDARRKSGSAEITSLCLYLFARRAP